MNIPVKLLLNGAEVGTFRSYGYETPWASGKIEFVDSNLFDKLIRLTLFDLFELNMDGQGLSEEEEEQRCNERLSELGISWEDMSLLRQRWQVELSNTAIVNISTVRFYENGFMEWRF